MTRRPRTLSSIGYSGTTRTPPRLAKRRPDGRQRALLPSQHLLDPPSSLPYSLLVLHQREPHEPLAQWPEPDPRRHRDQRLLQQQLRKLQRAHLPERLRNLRPHEHRPPRRRHIPPGFLQPIDQHVPPLLVHRANLPRLRLALPQRHNRRNLHRLKRPVVQVALDPRQRLDHRLVAQAEPDPPPRHGKDFDRHVLRALHLQNRRRPPPVETEVRVREIVQHHRPVLPRHPDHLAKEVQLHTHGRWIVGEGYKDKLRFLDRRLEKVL